MVAPMAVGPDRWHARMGRRGDMMLQVGTEAPDFSLRDQDNNVVSLSDFRDRNNVLLVFYPLAFTGTCLGELSSVQEHLTDFMNDKVQVLTVSVDSLFSHKVWALQQGFQFPLLADFWPHGGVAELYGVFDDRLGIANRGTFVIDRAGIIRFAELYGPGEARDQDAWRKALSEL
jgi:mycoredoxin-dependent peroxiredoxin